MTYPHRSFTPGIGKAISDLAKVNPAAAVALAGLEARRTGMFAHLAPGAIAASTGLEAKSDGMFAHLRTPEAIASLQNWQRGRK